MKYTLYHIKGVKWGMTERLEARLKQQGYTISDCYEFEYYDDMDTAADRERELNIKCGYGWNKQQDWRIAKNNSYKGGAKSKEIGQIQNIQPIGCILGGKKTGPRKKYELRKLNETQVDEIRTLYKSEKKYTLIYFAKKYNVSEATVHHIVKKRNYI